MSAVPADLALDEVMGESGPEPALPHRASLYFWFIVATATVATTPFLIQIQDVQPGDWITFAILGAAVAVAQIFVVVTPANQCYHTTGVFLRRGGAAAAAGARRADGDRPARPRLAQAAAAVPHPDVQHRELHAGRDGGVGGVRARDPRMREPFGHGGATSASRGARGLRRLRRA